MLPVTSARLAAVYAMLRSFPPFSHWNMPAAENVKFHVAKTDRWHAAWWIDTAGAHNIEVSSRKHSHLTSLIETMAHEMIHVRQRVNKTETKGTEHNAEFRRLGKLVCRHLGFDEGQFYG